MVNVALLVSIPRVTTAQSDEIQQSLVEAYLSSSGVLFIMSLTPAANNYQALDSLRSSRSIGQEGNDWL